METEDITMIVLILLVAVAITFFVVFLPPSLEKSQCEKYTRYGYDTKLEKYDEGSVYKSCFVQTEDSKWILATDIDLNQQVQLRLKEGGK